MHIVAVLPPTTDVPVWVRSSLEAFASVGKVPARLGFFISFGRALLPFTPPDVDVTWHLVDAATSASWQNGKLVDPYRFYWEMMEYAANLDGTVPVLYLIDQHTWQEVCSHPDILGRLQNLIETAPDFNTIGVINWDDQFRLLTGITAWTPE